jgi:DNA-binding CsgD family transcriptional regulator
MSSEIKNLNHFLSEFAKRYDQFEVVKGDIAALHDAKLSHTEFIYVLDFALNAITFAKGMKEFLGFDDGKMSIEKYLGLIHPQDGDLVAKIGKESILHSFANPNHNGDNVLYLSFRIKNKEGEYLKVLSQSSVFELDMEGNMISSLVKVSDLSFMEDNEVVKYKFLAANLNEEEFRKKVFGVMYDLFTSRELDIIKEINNGHSNTEIGKILGISMHTVSTHRKKIMKKSGCHSAQELLLFCRKNGVL